MVASTWTVTAAVGPARWRTSGLTTRCMIASSTRLNVTPTTANVTKSRNPLLKPMNGFNDGTAREANRARAYHPGPMRVTHRAGRGHWAPAAFAAIGAATALVLALPLPSGSAAAPPAAPTSPSGAPLPAASVSQTTGRWFDRVFVVVLENKDRSDVLDVPYFAELARRGEQFPRFVGETHPSQPELPRDGGGRHVRARRRAPRHHGHQSRRPPRGCGDVVDVLRGRASRALLHREGGRQQPGRQVHASAQPVRLLRRHPYQPRTM